MRRQTKTYRNFAAKSNQMEAERAAAYREYFADVAGGAFPEGAQSVQMDEAILNRVWGG